MGLITWINKNSPEHMRRIQFAEPAVYYQWNRKVKLVRRIILWTLLIGVIATLFTLAILYLIPTTVEPEPGPATTTTEQSSNGNGSSSELKAATTQSTDDTDNTSRIPSHGLGHNSTIPVLERTNSTNAQGELTPEAERIPKILSRSSTGATLPAPARYQSRTVEDLDFSYCNGTDFYCQSKYKDTQQPHCVPSTSVCDLKHDCSNSLDERDCVRLSISLISTNSPKIHNTSEGYVFTQEKGVWKMDCLQKWEESVTEIICRNLGFTTFRQTLTSPSLLGVNPLDNLIVILSAFAATNANITWTITQTIPNPNTTCEVAYITCE